MAETYGTTADIPGDSITVREGGTVAAGVAFTTTLGLVGSMDTANGSATPGEVQNITSQSDADGAFGADSELATQVNLALSQGGVSTIFAAGTPTTTTTQSETASQQFTIDDAPAMDPRVTTHEVTGTDTAAGQDLTVNIVDASPPSEPTDANTVNFNPRTGEVHADESSDYDITYTYADWSTAIDSVAAKIPRILSVCTEAASVRSVALSTVNNYDPDFDFMHLMVGAPFGLDGTTYTPSESDRRLAVVATSRGWLDEAETDMARTVGAAGGLQASVPLGDSTASTSLNGFASLGETFSNSTQATMIDNGLYPLGRDGGIEVVKDTTTSDEAKFGRISWSEIVDEAVELSHQISKDFVSEANTENNRLALGESHRNSFREMQNDNLLDAFYVSVVDTGGDEVSVNVGLDLVDYMDKISVDISVGDVVLLEGVQ